MHHAKIDPHKAARRSREEAKLVMWDYYRDRTLLFHKSIHQQRESIIADLIGGLAVEEAFDLAVGRLTPASKMEGVSVMAWQYRTSYNYNYNRSRITLVHTTPQQEAEAAAAGFVLIVVVIAIALACSFIASLWQERIPRNQLAFETRLTPAASDTSSSDFSSQDDRDAQSYQVTVLIHNGSDVSMEHVDYRATLFACPALPARRENCNVLDVVSGTLAQPVPPGLTGQADTEFRFKKKVDGDTTLRRIEIDWSNAVGERPGDALSVGRIKAMMKYHLGWASPRPS